MLAGTPSSANVASRFGASPVSNDASKLAFAPADALAVVALSAFLMPVIHCLSARTSARESFRCEFARAEFRPLFVAGLEGVDGREAADDERDPSEDWGRAEGRGVDIDTAFLGRSATPSRNEPAE